MSAIVEAKFCCLDDSEIQILHFLYKFQVVTFISVAAMSRDLNARVITHFWLISGEHSEQLNPQKAPRPGGSSLLCLEAFSLTLLIRLCLIDSCLVISSTKNKKQCISVCTHLEPQLFYQFPFTPFNRCCRSSHISQHPRTIK